MKNKKISKKSSTKKLNSNNIVLYLTLALSISTLVLAVVLFITRASSKTPETYLMRASKESLSTDYCGDGFCSSYEKNNCICEKDCGLNCTPIPTPTPPVPPTPTPPSINPPYDSPITPTPTSKPTLIPTPTPRVCLFSSCGKLIPDCIGGAQALCVNISGKCDWQCPKASLD